MGSKSKAHDAFRKIDKDRSGSLDAAEFKLALKLLNLHLSAKQTHAIMMHLDDDGDGTISLDEFMRLVWQNKLKLLRQKLGAAAYAIGGIDVEKLYQHYDRDSSGELDFEEFRRAVRKDVGMTARDVPDDELYEMFVFVDTDGGGKIGLEEFAELMPGDETHASRARHASVPGQAFSKILESADERRANMLYLFHRFDTDGSGGLDREEFRHAMLSLEVVLSVSELDEVMEEMDNDGNGFVTAQEFSDRMRVAKKDRRIVEGGTGGGGGVGSPGRRRQQRRRAKKAVTLSKGDGESPQLRSDAVGATQPAPVDEALDRLTEAFRIADNIGGTERAARGSSPRRTTGTKAAAPPNARASPPRSQALSPVTPARSPAAVLDEALNRLAEGMGSKSKAHDAFRKIDKDRSGSLDAAEFKLALKLLNLHLSAKQTHAIMMHLDDDGDGTISLDEFMRLVWQNKLKLLRQKLGAAAYAIGGIDVEKLYQHYDRDSSGELDFEEFRRAVRKDVGMTARDVPDDELYEMFVFVDTDGGGKIGLEEFAELMPGDETHASRARHASVPGQAFSKILESADERRANMLYLFHRFDTDGSGGLDREEFRHAMLSLEVVLSVSELDEVMEEMDNDGNGFVTAQEFSDRMRVAKKDRRIVEGGTGGGGGGGRGVSSGGSPRRRQRRTKAVASPRRITGSSGSDKRSPGRRPATVLTPEYSRQRAALESEVAGLERWVAALEVRQQGSAAPGGDDSDGVSNSGAAPEPEPEPQPEPESKREHGHDSSGSLSPDGRHSNSRQSRASPSSTSKHSPKQEATAVNLARAQQKQQLEQWLRDEQQVEAPVDLVVAAFDHAGGFSADEWLPTLQAMSTYDRDAFLQVRKRRSFAPFYT